MHALDSASNGEFLDVIELLDMIPGDLEEDVNFARYPEDCFERYVVKFRNFNKAERDKLASEGKALPDGSYPIESEKDLENAITLARSGHGDVEGAKKLIKKMAKKLGAADKLPQDWGGPDDDDDDEKAKMAADANMPMSVSSNSDDGPGSKSRGRLEHLLAGMKTAHTTPVDHPHSYPDGSIRTGAHVHSSTDDDSHDPTSQGFLPLGPITPMGDKPIQPDFSAHPASQGVGSYQYPGPSSPGSHVGVEGYAYPGPSTPVAGTARADNYASGGEYSYPGPSAPWRSAMPTTLFANQDEAVSTDAVLVRFGNKRVENGMVIRSGKIFEAGNYPDKKFSMTPFELADAAYNFRPAPIDLGHPDVSSPLDGKMGRLRSVAPSNNFMELYGEVELPVWLDDQLGDEPVPVSPVWNRFGKKRLQVLSLVSDPRVSDAALTAAFAKSESANHWQDIHNKQCAGGASCGGGEGNSPEQQIHDLAVANGAKCRTARMSVDPNTSNTTNKWLGIIPKKEQGMSMREWVAAWFAAGQPENFSIPPNGDGAPQYQVGLTQPPAPAPAPAPAAAFAAGQVAVTENGQVLPRAATDKDAELAQLKMQLAEERATRTMNEAVNFAEGEITSERAAPSERDDLIDAYVQASADDQAHGVAKFANGDTRSRVDMLRARHSRRPRLGLTKELMAAGITPDIIRNAAETAQFGKPRSMDSNEKARLLGMTPLGQKVQAGRN